MNKKFPKSEFQSKIEGVLERIHDDLLPLTHDDEHRDKVKQLVADAIEMEFEDWDTAIKCSEYDPQVE
jgi:C4-type Zn-finger protein